MDHFGFEETVDRLGERVVITVPDAADGGFDAGLGQALGVADAHILGRFKWSSQHWRECVAMGIRRRRSDRARRPALRSPGRPGVARRENRRRFWVVIAAGLASEAAAVEAGVSSAVGIRWFREAGGMPPSTLAPS